MKCLRIYADEKGESHFSDMEIAVSESQLLPGLTTEMSAPASATSIQFVTLFGWTTTDWHRPPARQFVISLDRTIEIETSDGQRRQVQPSSVILVEDTWGKGHKTRSLGDSAGTLVFVALAEDSLR